MIHQHQHHCSRDYPRCQNRHRIGECRQVADHRTSHLGVTDCLCHDCQLQQERRVSRAMRYLAAKELTVASIPVGASTAMA